MRSSPAAAPVVKASRLAKTYGTFEAVRGISFGVRAGTCTGLLGPNGAGKSTTLRMLLGLTTPSGGTLTIFDTPVAELARDQRARIGLVPQEDNLDPDLSVAENIFIYGLLFGMSHAELNRRVPELLAFMQLGEKADARVGQLSGGMKRRLTLARGLVNDPDLIVFDEPTTGLDPQARVLIWQRLLELKRRGKTLLLTTHYMDEAQRLCDHIVLIDHGSILAEGSPQQMIVKFVKPHVFEVTKPLPKNLQAADREDLGDSVLFYVKDAKSFRKLLPDDTQVLHRPANLEDVFLKLTGHTLRD